MENGGTDKWPEIAAVVTPMGDHALVRRGQSGYWPLADVSAEDYNRENGVAANVASAYLHGSMFGWETPGAHPEHEMNRRALNSPPRERP